MHVMWQLQLTVLLSIFFAHAATWRDLFDATVISYILLSTLILLLWMYKHYKSVHALLLVSLMYPWFDTLWAACIIILLVHHIRVNKWVWQLLLVLWSSLIVHKLFMLLFGASSFTVFAYALLLVSYTLVRGIPNIFSDSLDNTKTMSVVLGSMNSMKVSMISSVLAVVLLSFLQNPFLVCAWSYPAVLAYMFHKRKFELLRYEWQYLFFVCVLTLCVTLAGKAW